MFDDVQAADLKIETLPGCENIRYERVVQPAFLDHNGEAQAVKTQMFGDLAELRDFLTANDGKLYILCCRKMPRTIKVPAFTDLDSRPVYHDGYMLRSAPIPPLNNDWLLAKSSPVLIDEQSGFRPFVEVVCRIRTDKLQEIQTARGENHVTERLGRTLLKAVAEKQSV